ncbi:MAG: CRISPR-associated protein Cas4 [Calditrichia bacterium]
MKQPDSQLTIENSNTPTSFHLTATHVNYFFVCHRKLWLFSNGIQMEHTSELVDEGRFIHETAYPQRAAKYSEIELGGIKIDYFDARNKVVHEVKKSNRIEEAHVWQVKYYLYVLQRNGIPDATAILEYPRLRRREEIRLTQKECEYLESALNNIQQIIQTESTPPRIKKGLCKSCSYHDFCWSDE